MPVKTDIEPAVDVAAPAAPTLDDEAAKVFDRAGIKPGAAPHRAADIAAALDLAGEDTERRLAALACLRSRGWLVAGD